MESLQDILYTVPILEVRGDTSVRVEDIHFDSRLIKPGHLFVAVSGTQVDGHAYISKAIEKGASVIICEQFPAELQPEITWIRVTDSAKTLAIVCANFFHQPASRMQIIGVTGTNGKTTIATLLFELAKDLGYPAGLISTIRVCINDREIPATHTTPDARSLHSLFADMLESGCRFCFMEVSSHALVQNRVYGIPFAGAVFTNITRDHLDYHGTFQNYVHAKQILFNQLPASSFALTNTDDRNGMIMVQNSKARVLSYSLKKLADYQGKILENTPEGLQLILNGHEVWTCLRGSFNAWNLLAVYGVALELDLPENEVLVSLSKLSGVNGRFETFVFPGEITAIVDYAHTPDALQNVLENVRKMNSQNGRVIVVVGCGGNRDKGKRPEMAKIAAELGDQIVLTSDNPRNEDPDEIIREMEVGVPVSMRKKVLKITNRKEAIRTACTLAQSNDILVIAGKGHETYQEIAGVQYPFDDREIVKEYFSHS
jgi:UDP-N-acetylmuramoyl-L-alanyl-D-glutamate--2,6-diaminopimelate ligase